MNSQPSSPSRSRTRTSRTPHGYSKAHQGRSSCSRVLITQSAGQLRSICARGTLEGERFAEGGPPALSAEPTLKAYCRPVGCGRVEHIERQKAGAERSFAPRLPAARAGHKRSDRLPNDRVATDRVAAFTRDRHRLVGEVQGLVAPHRIEAAIEQVAKLMRFQALMTELALDLHRLPAQLPGSRVRGPRPSRRCTPWQQ